MDEKNEHFAMTESKDRTENDDQHLDLKDASTENLVPSKDDGCMFCPFVPKRYMVTLLAMFGFFNAYALRVNLSVAMVAMVTNVTKYRHGLETEVSNLRRRLGSIMHYFMAREW